MVKSMSPAYHFLPMEVEKRPERSILKITESMIFIGKLIAFLRCLLGIGLCKQKKPRQIFLITNKSPMTTVLFNRHTESYVRYSTDSMFLCYSIDPQIMTEFTGRDISCVLYYSPKNTGLFNYHIKRDNVFSYRAKYRPGFLSLLAETTIQREYFDVVLSGSSDFSPSMKRKRKKLDHYLAQEAGLNAIKDSLIRVLTSHIVHLISKRRPSLDLYLITCSVKAALTARSDCNFLEEKGKALLMRMCKLLKRQRTLGNYDAVTEIMQVSKDLEDDYNKRIIKKQMDLMYSINDIMQQISAESL